MLNLLIKGDKSVTFFNDESFAKFSRVIFCEKFYFEDVIILIKFLT